MDTPQHGQERNRKLLTKVGKPVELIIPHGSLNMSLFSQATTVAEKYCQHCNGWISTEKAGLIGFVVCPECNNDW